MNDVRIQSRYLSDDVDRRNDGDDNDKYQQMLIRESRNELWDGIIWNNTLQ